MRRVQSNAVNVKWEKGVGDKGTVTVVLSTMPQVVRV